MTDNDIKQIDKEPIKTSAKKTQADSLALLIELLSKMRKIDHPEVQKLFEDFKDQMKKVW